METYNGLVRTPTDAIILFEACRLGLLPRVQRRLSEKERQSIRSGSVFVWDEREAGMRRWTDGKSWSASRVSGSFLTYREMEGKRGSSSFGSSTPGNRATKTPDSGNGDQDVDAEEGPDGYRYKPDGLMKQSFSITTSQGQHLHLISYYSRSSPTANVLRQPSSDPQLASIQPAKGMYPESTVNDQSTVPAVTRSPMPGAPNYVVAAHSPAYGRGAPHPHPYLPPGYVPHPAYMAYPLSPMHTPPPYALHYAPGMPIPYHPQAYAQPPGLPMNHAPPSSYDQRPGRLSESLGRPSSGLQPNPAPYTQSQPPPPVTQSYSQSVYSTAPPPTTAAPTEAPKTGFQIDPRLTAPAAAEPTARPPTPNSTEGGAAAVATPMQRTASGMQATPVTASQDPSITSLVHDGSKVNTEARAQNAEAERQGSASPGGTVTAPPQDIPSEKLGFREDKRVLSMLDRGFARV